MSDLVQVLNPKVNRYVLIDKEKGIILEHKEDEGPYPGIIIATKEVSNEILSP